MFGTPLGHFLGRHFDTGDHQDPCDVCSRMKIFVWSLVGWSWWPPTLVVPGLPSEILQPPCSTLVDRHQKNKSTQITKNNGRKQAGEHMSNVDGWVILAFDFNGERKGQSFRILALTPSSSIVVTWSLIFNSVCQALALDTHWAGHNRATLGQPFCAKCAVPGWNFGIRVCSKAASRDCRRIHYTTVYSSQRHVAHWFGTLSLESLSPFGCAQIQMDDKPFVPRTVSRGELRVRSNPSNCEKDLHGPA